MGLCASSSEPGNLTHKQTFKPPPSMAEEVARQYHLDVEHLLYFRNTDDDKFTDFYQNHIAPRTELQGLLIAEHDNTTSSLGAESFKLLAQAINAHPTMKFLRINGHNLNDQIDVLLPALQANGSLNHLDFYSCFLTQDNAMRLVQGLTNHPSIKTINLGGNVISPEAKAEFDAVNSIRVKL